MQIFLDTANLELIKQYASWGIVDGVTTNPSLIAKEGVSLEKRIKEIAEVVSGPISTEVMSTDLEGMLTEARTYVSWDKNVYVKVPMTPVGLQVVKILTLEVIKTNMTLVFSPAQALLAAKAGATLISAFVGRLDDIHEDGMAVARDILAVLRNYHFPSKLLVASIRHPQHVIEAAKMGADIATVPPTVLEQLAHHPLTDKGIQIFLDDWNKMKTK